MISQRWRLVSIFLTLTNLLALAAAQSFCVENGNYTRFSTYEVNLVTVLSTLSTKVDIHGFYNGSAGQSPDIAYAAVLCRGDIQLEECRSCIQTATAELVTACPNFKQADQWNEVCMVRYSNESMFGILVTFSGWYSWSLRNATSPAQYRADARRLVDNLRVQAASGGPLRKVAAGDSSSVDSQNIFALVQCTPDLSPQNCSSCLLGAMTRISIYCENSARCRVLWPSCNLRYMDRPFYNDTRLLELQVLATSPPAPPPQLLPPPPQTPPPPPQRPPSSSSPPPSLPHEPGTPGTNRRTVIIVTVSVLAGACVIVTAVLASAYLLIMRRRAKQKPNKEEDEPARDINRYAPNAVK